MTKKEFFDAHGIVYRAGKILAPWKQWVNLPLTYGSKTHCFGFSTLAGTRTWETSLDGKPVTMTGTCICQCEHCYGCAGRYAMPSVIDANAWRTYAARYHMDWLRRAITAQINWGRRGEPLAFVRVHITGDFFSREYVNMWREIKADCPETRMWAYTKNADAEHAFDDVDGFNIVKSVVPDFGFNFGKCEYIINMYKALRAAGIDTHICRCALTSDQHCDTCRACQDLKYVLFLEHGSAYNPRNDAHWDELVELIESAENTRHI